MKIGLLGQRRFILTVHLAVYQSALHKSCKNVYSKQHVRLFILKGKRGRGKEGMGRREGDRDRDRDRDRENNALICPPFSYFKTQIPQGGDYTTFFLSVHVSQQ